MCCASWGPTWTGRIFLLYSRRYAFSLCISKLRHVMAAPLAAATLYVEDTARSYLDTMTRKLAYCVAQNASSWLRPLPDPYSSPPSTNRFLADWLEYAQLKSTHLNRSDVSFDSLLVDVVVSRDGSYVALPAAVVHAMYRYNVVAAFKHGAIGHLIAKRITQRMYNDGKWPSECVQPAGSKATNIPENLLAYQCVADGLRSDLALNTSA
ncbi:hypothetical protein MTO96_023654 [Rhipicephalus appendiculatus]